LISFLFATRAPTGRNVLVAPSVKLVAIKADAALAHRNLGDERPHVDVEAAAVHAEIAGRIALPEDARKDHTNPPRWLS
jgi:hypothetical protein